MGLLPLEFTDGLTDSPDFRETLQAHERELDLTNTAIKHLIKDIKDLIAAAKHLSRAQRTLSDTLNNFNFQCIGNSQTDDEMVIANSFKDFARLLSTIEDERDRLLEKADEAFLEPIERFRREQIGSAKEAKKKFEKETAKYCQNLERYLNLSGKKSETQLWEADASNSMEQQHFFKAMSEYVLKLQEVNERKKFEFVETVLSFMLGWLTFYHQGHEIATDFYSVKMELQMRLQRTRNNFNMTQEETKSLRQKMLNNQEKFKQKFQDSTDQVYSREGYLFLMEKKAFTTSWTKHFCKYDKTTRRLTLIPFTQTAGKNISKEEKTCMNVKECIKRNQDTIDRRFCFDIVTGPPSSIVDDHSSSSSHHSTNGQSSSKSSSHSPNIFSSSSSHDNIVHTFQALSEEDYKCWLETLEARDPYPTATSNSKSGKQSSKTNDNLKSHHLLSGDSSGSSGGAGSNTSHFTDSYELDAKGYWFIKKCIQSIESKGLDQKGIYRVVGVTSRVRLLMEMFSQSKSINSQSNKNQDNRTTTPNNNDSDNQKYSHLDDTDLLPNLDLESDDFETKTITSALKSYLRNLNEPIMTFQLHSDFIAAAKLENRNLRIEKIHQLVHRLPPINFKILKILIEHLQKVAKLHDKNLMTSSNLGVCFGPTLLRTAEESVAAILDIKFVNVIAELLIENYEVFFLSKPTIIINDNMTPSMVPTSSSSHLQNICNYYKVNNFSQIQQRPLPNVPVNQYHQGTSYNNVTTTGTTNVVNRFLTLNNTNNENVTRSNSQDQLYTGMPSPSSSTTTSSALLSSSARNKTIQNSSNNGIGSSYTMLPSPTSSVSSILQHPQHSKQYQQQYYSTTYPNYHQMQQSQIGMSTSSAIAASRRPLRLSLSSSSPSPSLGSSAISTMATSTAVGTTIGSSQQSSPQQNLSIYPSQIVSKQSQQQPGWNNNLVSQQHHHHQQMQPSVSYQNLHYNVEMSAAAGTNQMIGSVDAKNRSPSYQTSNHLLHNRPMTSIGIIPPNSTYCSLLRPSDAENAKQQQQNRIDFLTKLHPNINYMATSPPSSSLTAANNNCSTSRTMNFSSSSSASLPSTPENSQQQFQSTMMMPVISTAISGAKHATISSRNSNATTNLNSISPSTSNNTNNNNNNNEQNKHLMQTSIMGIESSSSSTSLYPTNQNIYQSIARSGQSIYGSIFGSSTQQQQQHRYIIGAMTPQPLPSTTVRTRYVCIGGSDSELSFQPNTIITNVRTSREPGWLEGTLNGKTGLIPLNYVEFIE